MAKKCAVMNELLLREFSIVSLRLHLFFFFFFFAFSLSLSLITTLLKREFV